MRSPVKTSPVFPEGDITRPVRRSTWWREVLLIATFYGLYTLVRDVRGDRPVSVFQATTNAHRLIRVERALGLFHEANIQHWFLHYRELIRLCDDYYGTIHFVAVVFVLGLLFFRFPRRYRLWRNTLALATGLALIGFSFFPVLPPRLLPPGYHFVDTLRVIGGLWSFSSGPVNDVSNQYAAMPSLHTTWSAWCAFAVLPLIRPLWGKVLMLLYPAATIFCIIVTANHYFADVIAGLLLLACSYLLARLLTTSVDRWHARRAIAAASRQAPARTGLS
jgi:PAP2 superfamily